MIWQAKYNKDIYFLLIFLYFSHFQWLTNIFVTEKECFMDLKTYSSDLHYPTLQVEKNLHDSKILMPVYGGVQGEITAVMTYTYQHFVAEDEALKEMLEGVSIAEMKHVDLLGNAITALGGYPVIGGRAYWSGSYVNYTLDPKRFLRQNILAEENAILGYERAILNLSQDSVKNLIERIILDEEIHVKLFKEFLSSI